MPRVSPNKPCTRCKQYGHQEKLCPDIWRQFHSTTRYLPLKVVPNDKHFKELKSYNSDLN